MEEDDARLARRGISTSTSHSRRGNAGAFTDRLYHFDCGPESAHARIPADLSHKLADFRSRLGPLIEHWTKACQALERIARRREQQAADWSKLSEELDAAALADQPDSSAGGYRPAESDLVERDVGLVSEHLTRLGSTLETRSLALALDSLERLKGHRALYTDAAALLARQDRLAPDAVDRLTRRVEGQRASRL